MEWNDRDSNRTTCGRTSWCDKEETDTQTRTFGMYARNAHSVVAHKKWLTREDTTGGMGIKGSATVGKVTGVSVVWEKFIQKVVD